MRRSRGNQSDEYALGADEGEQVDEGIGLGDLMPAAGQGWGAGGAPALGTQPRTLECECMGGRGL